MPSGDLYQLTDVQTYLGQQVLNVYYYKQIAEPSVGVSNIALVRAWEDFVMATIGPVQNEGLDHVGVRVINLDNPDDFLLSPNSFAGTVSGDGMPPYVTFAFRLNRASRAVRNGQKRIGGISESSVGDGLVNPGLATNIAAIEVALGAIITDTISGASFQPRIVHLATEAGPGGDPPATPRADYTISSVEFTSVSTQNTRKFGRGA